MRRPSDFSSLVRAFVLGSIALGTGVPHAQTLLNTNGGFEATPVGVVSDLEAGVDGWALSAGPTATPAPTFEIVDVDAAEGDRALAVTVNGVGDNPWDVEATATGLAAVPGTTYRYAIRARTGAGQQGVVSFTVGNLSFSEYGRLGDQSIGDQWTEFVFEFTITDDQAEIRAPVHFSYDGSVGDVIYIDDLRIFNPNVGTSAVVLEAELGTAGGELATTTEGDVTYLAATSEAPGAGAPGAAHVVSFTVPFEAAGWYDLYARVSTEGDADGIFYGSALGGRDASSAADWIAAEPLSPAGFAQADAYVTGLGTAGAGVWKWVNLSENAFGGVASDSFYVDAETLSQTIEVGLREVGLRVDRLAFGRSDLFFRASALDLGGPGDAERLDPVDFPTEPIAQGTGKFLGNIYSSSQIENAPLYFNQVTPENAGKWGSVEGVRDVMNWGTLDAAYAFAKDNGNPFRFHVLVWGNQQPRWIAGLPPDEQLEEIQEWFDAVAERYPDIDYLEVVNEPLHDPPTDQPNDPESGNYIEALGGSGVTGWDWIIKAFEMARATFPSETKLMLNDYGILSSQPDANRYAQIVDLLKDRDLIDGIGVQGHAFSTRPGAPIKPVLDLLGERGLPIQVTEMDIDGNPTRSPAVTDEQSDARQLEGYRRIFSLVWEHPAVEGVTLWGWRPGLWRNDQEAFIVRSNNQERPAMVWMRDYLNGFKVDAEPGVVPVQEPIELLANRPNPFRDVTEIRFVLASATDVSLAVYDLLGREVATLARGLHAAGDHQAVLSGASLSSGIYVVRLQAGSQSQSRRIVVAR